MPREFIHEMGALLSVLPLCLPLAGPELTVHPRLLMPRPLNAHDVFANHLLPVFYSCGFIGVFVVTVPIIYMLPLSRSVELLVFCLLFVLCHLANWPMLHLRWRLWFGGLLTPYAAMCITALLFGSFGIPFILLASLLQ